MAAPLPNGVRQATEGRAKSQCDFCGAAAHRRLTVALPKQKNSLKLFILQKIYNIIKANTLQLTAEGI